MEQNQEHSQNSGRAVAVFSDSSSARIAAGMLESHGIRCIVNNTMMSSIYPLGNVNPNFGVQLLVHPDDFELAIKLLNEHGNI